MSPEQIRGEKLDGRSDLFSLGVVFYELLTGARPFPGDSITTLVYQILHTEPRDPLELRSDLPPAAREVFARLLAKSAEKRPANAREFIREIRPHRVADPRSPSRRTSCSSCPSWPARSSPPRSRRRPPSRAPRGATASRGGGAARHAARGAPVTGGRESRRGHPGRPQRPGSRRAVRPGRRPPRGGRSASGSRGRRARGPPGAPRSSGSRRRRRSQAARRPRPGRPPDGGRGAGGYGSDPRRSSADARPGRGSGCRRRGAALRARDPLPVGRRAPPERRPACPPEPSPVPAAAAAAPTDEPPASGRTVDNVYRTRRFARFSVSPDQARVYVDGRYVGTADDWDDSGGGRDFEFAREGIHRVRLELPGYRDLNLEVIVTPAAEEDTVELDDDLQRTAKVAFPKASLRIRADDRSGVLRGGSAGRDGLGGRAYTSDRRPLSVKATPCGSRALPCTSSSCPRRGGAPRSCACSSPPTREKTSPASRRS